MLSSAGKGSVGAPAAAQIRVPSLAQRVSLPRTHPGPKAVWLLLAGWVWGRQEQHLRCSQPSSLAAPRRLRKVHLPLELKTSQVEESSC